MILDNNDLGEESPHERDTDTAGWPASGIDYWPVAEPAPPACSLADVLAELRDCALEGDAAVLSAAGTRLLWQEVCRLQRGAGEWGKGR